MTTTHIAMLFLSLLFLPLVAATIWYRLRTHYNWVQFPFWLIYLFFTRLVWRAKISGPVPIPDGQGAVIVCNHSCPIDPAFIQMGVHRTVHWMVAREYSLRPGLAGMMRALGVIPCNRNGIDTAATKMAIRYAEQGGLVGMFPEGRINDTPAVLLPGRPGVALIALRAKVPVVPCYVKGAPYDGTSWGCFFMFARVRLTVGEPMDFSAYYGRDQDKAVLAEVTCEVMRAMARLAGANDFEPQLAGRRWKPGMEDEEEG
ncbi:MAG: 1-acyl-sn-glycerol-3-phosphate acyltransferase [Pirellulales bacterium]|nr:1-acyl-sn-glycerol-3-phosphate acyltransferase [Pirellulales bacterium]